MRIRDVAFVELVIPDWNYAQRTILQPMGLEAQSPRGQSSALFMIEDIRLIVTVPSAEGTPADRFLRRHGPGILDVGLLVDDVTAAVEYARAAGVEPLQPTAHWQLGPWRSKKATLPGIDDLCHSLVENVPSHTGTSKREHTLSAIDHIAICVAQEQLAAVIEHYDRAFGMRVTQREQVQTTFSGMTSIVLESATGSVRIPCQAPSFSGAPGQISDFLLNHGGPGVQHIALRAGDIFAAIAKLRAEGIEFLQAPSDYHEALFAQRPELEADFPRLRGDDVLFDSDESGDLLQIFSRSKHPRRTLFFELIERRQARGFGSGNIRALFRALERQMLSAQQASGEEP